MPGDYSPPAPGYGPRLRRVNPAPRVLGDHAETHRDVRAVGPQDLAAAALREPTRLLRDLLQSGTAFELAMRAELGVNATDLAAMEHLIADGPLSPGELSRRLSISTASTTVVIDRLIGAGHARREPHPHDRRSVLVVAEPASIARAAGKLMPLVLEIDRALDSFDRGERGAIERYLRAVLMVYERHLAGG